MRKGCSVAAGSSFSQRSASAPSALVLFAAIALASCTASRIRQEAIGDVTARWDSLPESTTHNLAVVRAWRGTRPSEHPRSMEVWCVETEIVAKTDAEATPESLLWIATRPGKRGDWGSAPLMTLSSTWPYEACRGQAPSRESPESDP